MQVAKWTYCLFFLCGLLVQSKAQELTLEGFVQAGLKDWVIEQSALPENVRFPWIEEIDVRTESDEFLLRRQEYTLRLAPSSPRLRAAQKSLYQHIANQPQFDLQEDLADKIKDINEDWLTLFMIDKAGKLLTEMKLVLQDQSLIINKEVETGKIDVEKAMNLYKDINELDLSQFKLTQEKERLFIAYGIEDFSIDFEQMPSCQELIQKMNEESLNSIKPFQAKMDFDMETINRELAVERADRNRLFDFLQLRYRGPHDNFFNERFSVGVGLQMDKKNSSLLKLKELELDKQQLETQQVYEEKAYASERTSLLSEAQKIFEEYQFFLEQSKSEKEKLNQLSKSYTQMNGIHPQFLLCVREREIRLDLEALSYEEQLYEIYLDFLELTQYFIYSEEKAAF